jgi:integrase/recombinase XerD
VKNEKGLSPNTLSAYEYDLAQLQQFLDGRELVTAGRSDISAFVLKLFSRGIEARSVARKVSCFRQFYKFLLLDGLIQTDPTTRIESPKVGRVLPKGLLSKPDMATALETLRPRCKGRRAERMRLRDRVALELLYGSGLRVTELVTTRVADINLADRCIHILGKGNKQRVAPFGHQAAEALREYLAPRELAIASLNRKLKILQAKEEAEAKIRKKQMQIAGATLWLFPGRQDRPITRQRFWQVVHARFQQIGCNVSPHTLRHACATHMMENGANLRVVQEVLGHADISTTEIYTHVTVESVRQIYLRCHPRANGKSRQMKLQLDLLPPEILTAGPILCSQCSRVAEQGKSLCDLHRQKHREARQRFRERAKLQSAAPQSAAPPRLSIVA